MRSGELRRAAVAGRFYEGTPGRLESQVAELIGESAAARKRVIAVVSPHAGFLYSGGIAGQVFGRIEAPDAFILVGPNHTGLGADLAVMSFGEWEIPGARIAVAHRLAKRILAYVDAAQEDEQAHLLEHSLEVQLPLLHAVAPEARIVPVVLGDTRIETCRALGRGIARAVREDERSVVLVASSDMSHYVSDATARELDHLAIERILELDADGLHQTVTENRISMCGFAPATAVLHAARELGATKSELVQYATSGDVSGDRDRVVGYAGILIY